MYSRSTQYSNTGYTLELSHSNMTKCCNYNYGGGIWLASASTFGSATVLFSHLVLSHNKARSGGGLAVYLHNYGNVTLVISSCLFSYGSALRAGGIAIYNDNVQLNITIEDTNLMENFGSWVSELIFVAKKVHAVLSLLNSTIVHTTERISNRGILMMGHNCQLVLNKSRMRFAKLKDGGLTLRISLSKMVDCQFEGSHDVFFVIYVDQTKALITNCTFSNNTGGHSVIVVFNPGNNLILISSSTISDNNMTGITLLGGVARFIGRNVIQNNRYTEGAGITLKQNSFIKIDGELLLYNNTANKHGGAILSLYPTLITDDFYRVPCSLCFVSNTSSVIFSGNRAGTGGSDIREHGSVSLCRDGQKTKWWLQCKY